MTDRPVSSLIALGSNIDPEQNLPVAVSRLAECFQLVAASSVWESAPVGFLDQAPFLNAAVLINTSKSAASVKQALLNIEDSLGRVRDPNNKNGPRTIDLDIALYGNHVVDDEYCSIPDSDIPDRNFLAVPLAELDFERIHPTLGVSLGSLARKIGGLKDLKLRTDIVLASSKRSSLSELECQFN